MTNDDGVCRPSDPSLGVAAFHARGERAWQDYLRTGVGIPAEVVFARLDARIAVHRERLLRDLAGGSARETNA